jgi:tetratricopeptide (TPR) repeat protein
MSGSDPWFAAGERGRGAFGGPGPGAARDDGRGAAGEQRAAATRAPGARPARDRGPGAGGRSAPAASYGERTPWGSEYARRGVAQTEAWTDGALEDDLDDEPPLIIVETRPAVPRRSGTSARRQPTAGRQAGAGGLSAAGRQAVPGARPTGSRRQTVATGRRPGPAAGQVASGRRRAVDGDEVSEPKATAKLEDATRAYSADRYQDALRILRRLSSQAPTSAAVKELLGLTLYRLGRWALALRELEAHRQLSGSYDQYPVIADCYRALHRFAEAEQIWSELRQASPSPELIAEGRLVAAGILSDRGDLSGAVKLLESSLRRSKPKPLHLRQWYALADLYERAGELPRARDLFSRIATVDPDAYDVRQRLVALA